MVLHYFTDRLRECSTCRALEQEVFKSFAFYQWAARRAILVDWDDIAVDQDMPIAPGHFLRAHYQIALSPTVIGIDPVVDVFGRELGRLEGYIPGTGPHAWISAFHMATTKSAGASV